MLQVSAISDMHAKNYLFIYLVSQAFAWALTIRSRLFRRGPVEYNYQGNCILRDRAGKGGTKKRDQILKVQAFK